MNDDDYRDPRACGFTLIVAGFLWVVIFFVMALVINALT